MFNRLAPRYDIGNRVLSLGLDQGWRRRALDELAGAQRGDVVDLCAGTLDLTVALLARGARHVDSIDFSEQMLQVGALKLAPQAPVQLITADARELPLPDESRDGIICAFGLRNVPGVHRATAECARVLRPGGRLVVLVFFRPSSRISYALQASYNRLVVPVVGGLVTGFSEAYRYLAGSIDAFQSRAEFEDLLRNQGFEARGAEVFPPVASIIVAVKQ
jgi:ubiquinone/menaquinone biosynthesis methyltransferase